MRRFKIHLLAALGVALIGALALALVNLGPTVAQAAPPEKGPQPYQFSGTGTCSVTTCSLNLPAIEPGKRLVIQNVSVSFNASTGAQPSAFLYVVYASSPAFYYLAPTIQASSGGYDRFRGNNQLLAFADNTGASAVMGNVVSGSMIGFSATVSGYLEPL